MTAYKVSDESVAWRIVDDEAVLMHADTSDYFCLNTSGTFLWKLMTERQCGPQELAAVVARQYEVSEHTAQADVEAFLGKLREAQLVEAEQAVGATAGGAAPTAGSPATSPYEPPDLVKFGDLETLILSGE